jgi:hypothetical protein
MNLEKKYQEFYEVLEARKKGLEVNFQHMEKLLLIHSSINTSMKNKGLYLKIPEHVFLRASTSNSIVEIEDFKDMLQAIILQIVTGKIFEGFYLQNRRFGRTEIKNHLDGTHKEHKNPLFIVAKDWISEKNQIDIISIGKSGNRSTSRKVEKLSNEEKRKKFK